MYSARSTRALPRVGFPIRRSRDQRLVSTSPALIAAAHVLHRLLAPRHPPCALVLLIEKNTLCVAMEFSRCDRAWPLTRKPPLRGRSLTTQQRLLSTSTLFSSTWLFGRSLRQRYHQPATGHRNNCSGI